MQKKKKRETDLRGKTIIFLEEEVNESPPVLIRRNLIYESI